MTQTTTTRLAILRDSDTNDSIGEATIEQIRASISESPEGHIYIDDDGEVIYPGMSERYGSRKVFVEVLLDDRDIEALRREAGSAGDDEQVDLCDRALDGDDEARGDCYATVVGWRRDGVAGA